MRGRPAGRPWKRAAVPGMPRTLGPRDPYTPREAPKPAPYQPRERALRASRGLPTDPPQRQITDRLAQQPPSSSLPRPPHCRSSAPSLPPLSLSLSLLPTQYTGNSLKRAYPKAHLVDPAVFHLAVARHCRFLNSALRLPMLY
ncbi:hypothetical protein VTN00DRAFT_207 [Thermoascus crustaceus]|uniref:uncharacterized protein n=1 Tax=Thermoascus crustaceus TaxID=5088 RepID=UPI0037437435